MARPKRDLKRVDLNLNVNVLEYIDQFAKDNYLSRTTAIQILCTQALVSLGYGNSEKTD